MTDSKQPAHASARRPALPPHIATMAKWPPDDDDDGPAAPAGGGGGGGAPMGGGGDDGNFKKGRFSPLLILGSLVAVGGLVAFLMIGFKQDQERYTVQQAEDLKKSIFILPKAEQVARWRELATTERSDDLRAEALKQLAWARDPAGIDAAIASLKFPNEPVQAMAATALAEYGSPDADKARPALLEAVKTAGGGCKPQILWSLVTLGEPAAFEEVMKAYRAGHLSAVQRLGGGTAFDAERIVKLVTLDKLAELAGDENAGVRQLVATVLSRNAEPKYTPVLIKLVQDPDPEVARQAAPGLGKIGDATARQPLLNAIKGNNIEDREQRKETRKKYLEALRDGIGTEGLVLALEGTESTDPNDQNAWFQRKQAMEMLRAWADPRGGDALNRYIASRPHIHWETEAATALAEVGDVRAVPSLAKRLRMDPTKIYSDQNDMEMALKRDDQERVVASRMIADLAVLHPEKAEQIRIQSEEAIWFWISEMPSPHANGLRALAAMGSTKHIDQMRKWANPDKPLPKEGQQPPMPEEWVIAQSAMRYVGWMKDDQSWKPLEQGLKRRSPELDVTMDGLMQGGVAILGMTLRALGVGAAEGFSQWGDNKAFKLLLEYIEQPKENEQARMAACAALAWVGTKDDMVAVAKKVQEYKKPDKADQFRRACFLEAFNQRPIPGTASALLPLMDPAAAPELETRHQVARAIGKAGFDKDVETKLFEMLKSDTTAEDAALALILGGEPDVAARAIASLSDKPKELIESLGELWFRTFGYWSTEDLEQGRLFRWVDNAVAISHLEIRQTAQEWARLLMMKQLENLLFDNGPHSFTRVVLRFRLYQMAQGDDAVKAAGAIRALKFMNERGVLQAVRDGKGPGAALAKLAFHELQNPKVVVGVTVPGGGDDKKK